MKDLNSASEILVYEKDWYPGILRSILRIARRAVKEGSEGARLQLAKHTLDQWAIFLSKFHDCLAYQRMTGSPRGDVLRGWLLGLLAYFVSSGIVTTADLELSGLSIELQCEKVNYLAFHSWFA